MLAQIGKALQLLGLTVLPVAMLFNLIAGDNFMFGVSNMLVMMVFGVAVFGIGWIFRGYGEPDEGDEEEGEAEGSKKKSKPARSKK